MRNLITALALTVATGAATMAQAAGPAAPNAKNYVAGDYVEARTASVFAGACHYNGELTTAGREAEMVWHVKEGAWNGVSLAGLSALASVASDSNLQDADAPRRSVLYIDARATPAQAQALADALKARCGKSLGDVAQVKRVSISFARTGETYRVSAKGVSELAVNAMPDHACCLQPNLVWYQPLVTLSNRRVGFTRVSGIQDKTLGSSWTKSNQNTAFYGAFSL